MSLLRDLKLWIQHRLETLKPRQSTGTGGEVTNSWAVAEIPDWELRQKLEAIEEALTGDNLLPEEIIRVSLTRSGNRFVVHTMARTVASEAPDVDSRGYYDGLVHAGKEAMRELHHIVRKLET